LQRVKTWWLAGLVCLVIILAGAGFLICRMMSKVDPALLITETMTKAQQATSYRFQIQSDFSVGTEKRSWTQVEGEKAGTSYHFKGTILGTPVEIYQIGSRSYTLDPVNKNWYVLDGADLTHQQIYSAEIDPLANFKFKAIQDPKLVGTEKVNNQNCWVLEFGGGQPVPGDVVAELQRSHLGGEEGASPRQGPGDGGEQEQSWHLAHHDRHLPEL